MADLRDALTTAGLENVVTYIQSGNVIFDGGDPDDDAVARRIADVVDGRFGFAVPVVVRSIDDLVASLRMSESIFPLGSDDDDGAHAKRTQVVFMSARPADGSTIDPERSPGDVAVVDGREVHVQYADGAGTSKLTIDHLERVLGVSCTARNLATVRKLIELATESPS